MKTILTFSAVICCSLFLMASCGDSGADTDASGDDAKATETTVAAVSEENVSDAYALYERFLIENAQVIEEYETCQAAEYSLGKNKGVSFCDINNDGIPEMFVMEYVHGGAISEYGKLYIYTCDGNAIKELPYGFQRQDVNGVDDSVVDFNVVAGGFCEYAAFLAKDGSLYLFSDSNNESSYAYLNRNKVAADGTIIIDHQLTWADIVDGGNVKHEYTEDGKSISEGEMKEKTDVIFANLDKMIIYGAGTYDGEFSNDLTLWKNLDESAALSMSCKDAITYAKEQQ